nr:poly(R)-hydroxyalkanoic acid synthase subunit PhaE [Nitrosopumilus sp.]
MQPESPSKENEPVKNETDSAKNVTDYYKHLSLFWTDLIHLMSSKPQALASIGPMRAFAANSKKVSTELIEINESLLEFNKYLTEYYKQLAETWGVAQKKVNLKSPEVPQDVEQIEAFKRIWIDIFDNDFTELFDSEKFGENYGKLVSKELELTKHWNNITNVILQSVNLPSKEEIDEVYKEMHSLKKRVAKLELELKKKESKNNAK